MSFVKPIAIAPQGTSVGIVQTSDADRLFPCRYTRALRQLRHTLPCEVRDYTIYSQPVTTTDSDRELAQRFQRAAEENELVLSLTGGYTSNCLLPHIDYDAIRTLRRIIVGYSDTSAVLCGIAAKACLATLHGPSLLGSFGEYPQVNTHTIDSLRDLTSAPSLGYCYTCTSTFTDAEGFWDRDDLVPLDYQRAPRWRSNSTQKVRGFLVGGNLDTLLALVSTPFFPQPKKSLLFLEDSFCSIGKLKRDIESLRQRGTFERVVGVLFGRFFQPASSEAANTMGEYVLDVFSKLNLPVLINVDFGHCHPQMSLPIGIMAEVDYLTGRICLCESFTEPALAVT